jgi:hypothetical protein
MTAIALFISIVLSVASMYWGYSRAGFEFASRWILFIGIVWLFSQWRWTWFSSLILFVFVFFSAFGLVLGFDFNWMLAGPVFALFAWELTEFQQRLRFSAIDDDTPGLERRHIARLSVVAFIGLLLVSLVLFLQEKFTFEWGIFLVIVAVLGLFQLVSWFRRQK